MLVVANIWSFASIKEGQKIARKLSIQITKQTQKLKTLLQEYNACHDAAGDSGGILSLSDVTDSAKLSQIINPCFFLLG